MNSRFLGSSTPVRSYLDNRTQADGNLCLGQQHLAVVELKGPALFKDVKTATELVQTYNRYRTPPTPGALTTVAKIARSGTTCQIAD